MDSAKRFVIACYFSLCSLKAEQRHDARDKRKSMMKTTLSAMAAFLISFVGGQAFAHTGIVESNISDGEVFSEAPDTFECTFGADVGLVSLAIKSATGVSVPVEFSPSPQQKTSFSVELPTLEAGAYQLTWRAVSKDGHVMSGEIGFEVAG